MSTACKHGVCTQQRKGQSLATRRTTPSRTTYRLTTHTSPRFTRKVGGLVPLATRRAGMGTTTARQVQRTSIHRKSETRPLMPLRCRPLFGPVNRMLPPTRGKMKDLVGVAHGRAQGIGSGVKSAPCPCFGGKFYPVPLLRSVALS